MDETTGRTGQQGAEYRERLTPGFGVWIILVGLGASLGIVVLPIGPNVGWIVAVAGIVVLVTLGWSMAVVVEVTGGELHAGRAVIGLGFVTAAEPLESEPMRVARGTGLDARAHLCLRGWVATGVRVRIGDPQDPTPYWLISSRHPAELAAALGWSGQAG